MPLGLVCLDVDSALVTVFLDHVNAVAEHHDRNWASRTIHVQKSYAEICAATTGVASLWL